MKKPDNRGEIIIFRQKNGAPEISVRMENDSLWLNQYQLAELFETDRTSIVKHIKNILETAELRESRTCAKFAQVQTEGGRVRGISPTPSPDNSH